MGCPYSGSNPHPLDMGLDLLFNHEREDYPEYEVRSKYNTEDQPGVIFIYMYN